MVNHVANCILLPAGNRALAPDTEPPDRNGDMHPSRWALWYGLDSSGAQRRRGFVLGAGLRSAARPTPRKLIACAAAATRCQWRISLIWEFLTVARMTPCGYGRRIDFRERGASLRRGIGEPGCRSVSLTHPGGRLRVLKIRNSLIFDGP